MEKIILANNIEIPIMTNGVNTLTNGGLRLLLIAPELNLLELEEIFAIEDNIKKIILSSEHGESLRVYRGLKYLREVSKEKNVTMYSTDEAGEDIKVLTDLYTIVLEKESPENKLELLEENQYIIMGGIAEISEAQIGGIV